MYDGDTFTECLTTPVDRPFFRFLQYLCFILGGVCFLGAVASFLAVVPALALWLAGWFFGNRSSVEYEYSLLGREMTIDAIYNKASRRSVGTWALDRAEGIYPEGSQKALSLEGRQMKVTDVSAGKGKAGNYVMAYEGSEKVIFTPDEEFLSALGKAAGSKLSGQ